MALMRAMRGRRFSSAPAVANALHGHNFVAGVLSSPSGTSSFVVQARRRVDEDLPGTFTEASDVDIDTAVQAAEEAVPGEYRGPSCNT